MSNERFGFRFWLGWILWFAGAFVLAAGFWTLTLESLFGEVQGQELTLSWATAVFGSWFLALIPFMRKKERIWKRLNRDQEKAVDAWLGGMAVFIGLLVVSCLFWSWYFREEIRPDGLSGMWARAVFGSWLFLVMPLLIFMYRKADQILKDAVARQTETAPRFRTAFVRQEDRCLSDRVARQLEKEPYVLGRGHIVTATLTDGRRISDVFVMNGKEILGVYGIDRIDFAGRDIQKVEAVQAADLPVYEETKWLRLDGRA